MYTLEPGLIASAAREYTGKALQQVIEVNLVGPRILLHCFFGDESEQHGLAQHPVTHHGMQSLDRDDVDLAPQQILGIHEHRA